MDEVENTVVELLQHVKVEGFLGVVKRDKNHREWKVG